MVAYTCQRLTRSIHSLCAPLTALIGFSCLLTFLFILYQPTPGPGVIQRLGWQAWDVVSLSNAPTNTNSNTNSNPSNTNTPDWWNVSQDAVLDTSSFPLDQWSPLLPHDTGLSEITLIHCWIDPYYAPKDLCSPPSTKDQDAIKGPWVRIPRNLNYQMGAWAGDLSVWYRRTRRQDVPLVDDIRLLPENDTPGEGEWTKVSTSLRTGYRAPALYLWYKTPKSTSQMSEEDKTNMVTELDVHFGEDVPWYGFDRVQPAVFEGIEGKVESTYIVLRRGVKIPPKAPPLHFSPSGTFKIMQIADLHFSVSAGSCRDIRPDFPFIPCTDNTTTNLLSTMLDLENPDLVVFTGDQLNGQGTTWDPKSVLAKFAKAVTDRGIPWAAVFGNHDSEEGGKEMREDELRLMQGLPYSLVERGPKDVTGVGNYLLKVHSADPSKTHLLTLYFLDSNSYSKGVLDFFGFWKPTEYDWIHQDQIDWFLTQSSNIAPIERPFTPDGAKDLGQIWSRAEEDVGERQEQITPQTKKLAKPNALMFFHIPLPEAYSPADRDPVTYRPLNKGIYDNERGGAAKKSDGFFDKALLGAPSSSSPTEQGIGSQEVKVVGNGHCHITENCRRVKGVWMCFGGGGSYSGYGKVG
ncbi:Phosphatase dcr2 [Paramarasmius palmivorus]|uniref:Phosphatase dcr2 n=1 Tax=Paramarasmius palmivorus TaxID=297713 RepID=A0AAW0EBK7_9AGAR